MNDRIEQAIKSHQKSTFRSKFKLSNKDRQYIQDKGIEAIGQHAIDFIKNRIAPEYPKNDGKQTPICQECNSAPFLYRLLDC